MKLKITLKQGNILNISDIHNVYFIGIGGIGMSAIARYFNSQGKRVAGYDRVCTDLTQKLQSEGIEIHYQDEIQGIPQPFKNPEDTLVVYTPAVKSLSEMTYFQSAGFKILKRSQVLGEITREHRCLAVAGTHGKTTTSSILAHILVEVDAKITAFLGGIAENFSSNYISKGTDWIVVEADEFDRSFLQLSPDIACITSVDSDHLDIYGSAQEVQKAFSDFKSRVKPQGMILVNENIDIQGVKYGFSSEAYYRIDNIRIDKGGYIFDIFIGGQKIENVQFFKPGHHNLLNALAAFAIATEAGFPPEKLAKALSTFKGVQRRFTYVLNTENKVMIDDYAHHPSEIDALYQAVTQLYPSQRATIIFQPHLFSRTRDFMEGFAQSLSKFDQVILYDIYPAREEPIAGVTSQALMERITHTNVQLLSKNDTVQWVKKHQPELLLTVGAGDISFEVERLKQALL